MISVERMHWWMHCEIKWGSNTNEGALGVDVEIGLKGGLTRGMVGARATINSMQKRGAEQLGCNLAKYPSRMKGASIEDGTWSKAQCFPWT